MSWNPHQKIYVDEDGKVWDVTDEEHPIRVGSDFAFDPPSELNLTEDDKSFMRSLRIKT